MRSPQPIRPLRSHIIFIIIISFITVIGATHTSAQTPPAGGLSVTPPTFELTGNPGTPITNTIRIENTNDYPVDIAVDRRNFTAIGEEGAVGITEEETSFSLASWITVEPEETRIPAKSTRTFKFTIEVPLQAEPGGHFGSLIFRTIPREKVDGSGATLAQEIGSLILLKISGDTIEEATIESFTPQQSFYEYGPVVLEARVKNTGNIHVKPSGTISITNMFGQKVASVTLDSKNVLPGAVRKLESTWDTKWRLGRYTATLVMIYGSDQVQRAVVSNFIVFPYRAAGVAAIALALLGIVLYRSRKRLRLAFKILFTGRS